MALETIEKGQRWIFDTAERSDGTLMAVNLRFEAASLSGTPTDARSVGRRE